MPPWRMGGRVWGRSGHRRMEWPWRVSWASTRRGMRGDCEGAEALAAAGVPFEIVPGVTAPLGIAAYTGVPLTHREHTSAVTFVTGHAVQAIDWDRVGHAETLVIFMGLTTFGEVAREL